MRTLPHGTWPSPPLTPETMAAGQVVVDEVRADGRDTYWLEGRAAEGGRQALVRHDGTGAADVLPAPWSVRTRVHEYGGGAYAVDRGTVVLSDARDGRLHRLDPGSAEPVAITPEGPWRFGGLVLAGGVLLAVREDHSGPGEPVDTLVRLDPHGENPTGGTVVHEGTDFVSRPALSPDGRRVAFVTWDHPDMPWDTTTLHVADLGPTGLTGGRVVAGAPGVSVAQPAFGPDGALWFVADESGWWTLHRDAGDGPQALHTPEADHAQPQWVLGMHDYAVLDADHALVRWWTPDGQGLGVLDARTGSVTPSEGSGAFHDHLVATGDGEVVLKRGAADRLPEVVRGPAAGPFRVLASSGAAALHPDAVSLPRAWSWTNGDGDAVHGILHEPRHPEVRGPDGELPPLVVMAHGGPTSRTEAAYASATQFWTSRGYAVLLVNYSGSTGYGRAYRDRLRGRWGELDIDDCVTGAVSLADAGRVDRARLVVRGGSAGGYVVLRAMTTSTVFAAGTSSSASPTSRRSRATPTSSSRATRTGSSRRGRRARRSTASGRRCTTSNGCTAASCSSRGGMTTSCRSTRPR